MELGKTAQKKKKKASKKKHPNINLKKNPTKANNEP